MNVDTLSTDFNEFTVKWNKQLSDVSFILKFLNSYPVILNNLEIGAVISAELLFKSQKDWFNSVCKYKGLEKEFFHQYWVPIQKESLDYFIDLSYPKYPIFKILFSIGEPYKYKKLELFESINELMMLEDSNLDIEQISSRVNDKWNTFF